MAHCHCRGGWPIEEWVTHCHGWVGWPIALCHWRLPIAIAEWVPIAMDGGWPTATWIGRIAHRNWRLPIAIAGGGPLLLEEKDGPLPLEESGGPLHLERWGHIERKVALHYHNVIL